MLRATLVAVSLIFAVGIGFRSVSGPVSAGAATPTATTTVAASTPAGGATPAQQPAPCPAGVTLTVSPPAAGAPTTVTVSLSQSVNLKPPTANDPNSFHLHYFVDTAPVPAGQAVPRGNPKIIHSPSTTQDVGPLDPGQHTVTVVLGQFNHTACETRGSVTFTVVGSVPTTGGGSAPGGSPLRWALWLIAAGAAMVGLAGLARVAPRRVR